MISIVFEGYTTKQEGDDAGHREAVGKEVAGVGEERD